MPSKNDLAALSKMRHVKATVSDITARLPRDCDHVVLDTNVLYWVNHNFIPLGEAGGRIPEAYQTEAYPNWVDLAVEGNSTLCVTPTNLTELIQLLERAELEVCWLTADPKPSLDPAKPNADFSPYYIKRVRDLFHRDLPGIRKDIGTLIASIRKNATLLETPHTEVADRTAKEWMNCSCDAADAQMIATAKQAGINQIISDDRDLIYIEGIHLLTANPRAIELARRAGRLA